MGRCPRCTKITGALLLVAGILLVVQDLGYWNLFGIQWYTLGFLIFGVGKIASTTCKDCRAGMPVAKGKK